MCVVAGSPWWHTPRLPHTPPRTGLLWHHPLSECLCSRALETATSHLCLSSLGVVMVTSVANFWFLVSFLWLLRYPTPVKPILCIKFPLLRTLEVVSVFCGGPGDGHPTPLSLCLIRPVPGVTLHVLYQQMLGLCHALAMLSHQVPLLGVGETMVSRTGHLSLAVHNPGARNTHINK